jgi:hypothetical protein
MARKTIGYTELEWVCQNCHGKNPGAQKTCSACGAPQPENVQFQQAQKQDLLSDAQKIAAAQKGADVHCPYCGTRNAADAPICSQCGGDLKEGTKHVSGTVVGAFATTTGPVKQIPCPNCANPNPETNKTCSACGAVLNPARAGSTPEIAAAQAAGGKSISIRPWMALPLMGILLVCCVIIGFFFLHKTTSTGVVQSLAWERAVAIQELRNVTLQAWKSDLPDGAQPISCTEKHRFDQDNPAPNAKEVCGTPYQTDQGNGFAEVAQDCHYEVYEDYCKYTAQEWQSVDQAVAQGSNLLRPQWPDVKLRSNQRAGERSATYTIQFQLDSGVKEFSTSDEQLFNQMQPGTRWTLEIDTFGNIVNVQPVE